MIVEDEVDVAELERQCLADKHHVTVVSDGFGRLVDPDGFDWTGVDVAIVDLMLKPGGHPQGEDILAWLAQAQPRVRRIVVSAKPIGETKRAKELAHEVLLKPFDARELMAVVGRG